jgi:hypothetical protein
MLSILIKTIYTFGEVKWKRMYNNLYVYYRFL